MASRIPLDLSILVRDIPDFTISNPETEPDGYDMLQPGDFAIFEFQGRIFPTAAKLILISQTLPVDRSIHPPTENSNAPSTFQAQS
jgi:hypothetical protein